MRLASNAAARLRVFSRALFVLLLTTVCVTQSRASSILRVGLADMLEYSELVFHGRVLDSRFQRGITDNDIRTVVAFEVIEIIKGNVDTNIIDISFMGGTLNGLTLLVSESNIPIIGEEGIYFVEQLQRPQVNPIFGWSQGHFKIAIAPASREKRVLTFDERPVYALNPEKSPVATEISNGRAAGVRTEALRKEVPMGLAGFKMRLRELARR